MRIISKEHDYYDAVQSLGQDQSVIYHRQVQEFNELRGGDDAINQLNALMRRDLESVLGRSYQDIFKIGELSYYENKHSVCHSSFAIRAFYVAFCGTIHRGISISSFGGGDKQCFYDVDSFASALDKRIPGRIDQKAGRYSSGTLREVASQLFTPPPLTQYRDFLAESKIISALIGNGCVVINPVLKAVEFFKVLDSYMAYQEIDMWVSGVLSSQNKLPEPMTDKEKVGSHGFNHWSFRKMPTP